MLRKTVLVSLLLALGACQESGIDLSARSGRHVVVGPNIPVAIVSLEGASDAVAPRFSAALASEAQLREISFVDSANAPRFKLRGYISAVADPQGTLVTWVWDVFDQPTRRAQRVSGSETIRRSDPANPWNSVDDAVLRRVAARSLEDIASFLVGTKDTDPPVATGKTSVPKNAQGSSQGSNTLE